MKHQALSMGQGGYETSYQFETEPEPIQVDLDSSSDIVGTSNLQDGPEIIEVLTDASAEKTLPTQSSLANLKEMRRAFPTQAYMLIFIREDEID